MNDKINENKWIDLIEYRDLCDIEYCFVYTDKGNIYSFDRYRASFSICEIETILKYMIIPIPDKPI